MFLIVFLLLFSFSANASITFVTPLETELSTLYTSAVGVGTDCSKGLTITMNATDIAVANNNIRVESSNKTTKLVCFKYNGVNYGTSCNSCITSPMLTLPAYPVTGSSSGSVAGPAGPNVTIFIPYLEMVDSGSLSTLTSFTLTVGIDCAKTGCTVPTGSLSGTYADIKTITMNIDNTPPTGYIGAFTIEKGDASIYIDSFDTSGLTDTGSGLYRVRFYYTPCGTTPDATVDGYNDFLLTTSDWLVKGAGLVNGTPYTLRATVFDKAGNQYAADTYVHNAAGVVATPVNVEDTTSECVTPTPILGFLSNKEGCFVATEVFGRYSKEVSVLRAFRDNRLKKHPSGVLFVKLYYKASPFLISTVRQHPMLRTFVSKYLEAVFNVINFLKLDKK